MRLVFFSSVILWALVISACSSLSMGGTPDETVIVLKLYERDKFPDGLCGGGKVGCTICTPSTGFCEVHSIRERCVLDHELDHVLHGDFHKGREATCRSRAT